MLNTAAEFKAMEHEDFGLFEADYTHVGDADVEDAADNQQSRYRDFDDGQNEGGFDRTRAVYVVDTPLESNMLV
jgi:hypothetical protein